MGDAWIFIAILAVALLLATPAVRRWLTSDEKRPLVDPDQSITVEPVADQGPMWFRYQMKYRTRRAARGRRHQAPASPSPDRIRRDPPPS